VASERKERINDTSKIILNFYQRRF